MMFQGTKLRSPRGSVMANVKTIGGRRSRYWCGPGIFRETKKAPGRGFTGHWSAPALYALEGGNIGFQLGGQATDFVLLVMNPRGATSLMSSKVKLGADAAAAAGPKGRTATGATDVVMRAEILSYSRSRGLFAGVSLEGSTLRPDNRANEKLYGRKLSAREIVRQGKVSAPASARELLSELNTHSPKNRSEPKSLK